MKRQLTGENREFIHSYCYVNDVPCRGHRIQPGIPYHFGLYCTGRRK